MNQIIINEQNNFDFAGGMNLFDFKPILSGSKFTPYPYHLKYIPSYVDNFEFREVNYLLKNQQGYKRIKSIYRLMYLVGKVMKSEKYSFKVKISSFLN